MATTKKSTVKKAPVKKALAKKAPTKTLKKVDVPGWSTIHVFGYGETQIIGHAHNGKVANSELKALEPLMAALAAKQQKGTKVSLVDTHALNIFNGLFVDFRPKSATKNNGQRFAWSDIDAKHIDKLATEVINKMPEQKPRRNFMELLRKNNSPEITKKATAKTTKKATAKK